MKILFAVLIILSQILYFRNYLFPFLSENMVVKGQKCTCPHATVKSGTTYLKTITPDSLIKYKLDYSEIYFENEISATSDPMGVDQYVISGKIVGKASISEGDEHYFPLFRIERFENAFLQNIFKWFLRCILVIELFVLYSIFRGKRHV